MRTAAILAGGQARRFGGRSKALLSLGDQRIIDRQITILRVVADHLAIVANDRNCYSALGVPVWEDLLPSSGPLSGIYTALMNATTPHTVVVAGDMPFLTAPFLQYLARASNGTDITIPRTVDGYQPLCACYSSACATLIQRNLEVGMLKVTDLLPQVSVREVGPDEISPYDPDGKLFFNINTPADYKRALELAAQR